MAGAVAQLIQTENTRRELRGGKPRKFRKPPKPTSTNGIEVRYARDLSAIVRALGDSMEAIVITQLGRIETLAKIGLRSDGHRADAETWQSLARNIIGGWASGFDKIIGGSFDAAVLKYSHDTDAASRSTFRRQMRSLFAVDVFAEDPGAIDSLASWRDENTRLWTNVTQGFVSDAEGVVIREFQAGRRVDNIAEMLRDRLAVTRQRSILIATDQIQKLNGELTRRRQKQAGIPGYIWRTSKDSRVRSQHAEREGKAFTWDNPPSDGHPGQPVRCRCYAEPDISALLGS